MQADLKVRLYDYDGCDFQAPQRFLGCWQFNVGSSRWTRHDTTNFCENRLSINNPPWSESEYGDDPVPSQSQVTNRLTRRQC
jgi:hypothetical protein